MSFKDLIDVTALALALTFFCAVVVAFIAAIVMAIASPLILIVYLIVEAI